jgi:hypothetical protein
MMGKNTGKIMPADRVRPGFDNRFDLALSRSVLMRHGSHSEGLSKCFRFASRRWPKITSRRVRETLAHDLGALLCLDERKAN